MAVNSSKTKSTDMNYSKSQNLSLLILRLIIAAVFAYAAYGKFPFWTGNPYNLGSFDLNLTRFLSIAEPIGALALILGLLTRLAAACLAIIMAGAIYYCIVVYKLGFMPANSSGWGFNLCVLGGCIILMAFGAGGLSVDASRGKR
jgi:putative oxidoreductase